MDEGPAPIDETPGGWAAARERLGAEQLAALARLAREVAASNGFYGPRLRAAGLAEGVSRLADWRRLPLTTKAELVADQRLHPPYGTNLTYPLERYCRLHQTSGTSGQPLRWLDTRESWRFLLRAWVRVFEVAGVTAADRMLFPFSFGPFLGFWTAFDAALELGALVLPGGGLDSRGRLRLLVDNQATVVCSTPTYALRLAEVAAAEGVDLGAARVRALIVAGEPGGSVPKVRERLAAAWGGARVFDHHGMTEVGPVSFPNPRHADVLHVLESSYFAEVLDPATGEAVAPGELGELVLTTLGRPGSPLLRYRTGDLVRPSTRGAAELGVVELALEGGILARADDMVVVRGVNLYPSAVEEVVRSLPEIVEYRVLLDRGGPLVEMRVEIETLPGSAAGDAVAARLRAALRTAFQLRVPVATVPAGSLPRFELKAKRWVDA